MVAEVITPGSRGNSRSTAARLLPRHILRPNPPLCESRMPIDSGSISASGLISMP
jgi:hypothetical protein